MLRAALDIDISWKSHTTNKELYGDLPKITTNITMRRLRFAGHCKRRKGSKSDYLATNKGERTAGRPFKNVCRHLQEDTYYTTGAIIGIRHMTPE